MSQIISTLNQKGFSYVISKAFDKIGNRKVRDFELVKNSLYGKSGLEVGGPSRVFESSSFIPIYPVINALDGCNFSDSTLWEGNIDSSEYSFENGKAGNQYIREATDLSGIENEKYDFIISSHCLEHVANPIKGLKEWLRVTKIGGFLLVVLPNKKYTFDHKRPYTEYDHIINDFESKIGEDDLTHLEEILSLHDLKRDPLGGSFEQFKARSKKNFENRALHQHVFSLETLEKMFNFLSIEVLSLSQSNDHLVAFGRKK